MRIAAASLQLISNTCFVIWITMSSSIGCRVGPSAEPVAHPVVLGDAQDGRRARRSHGDADARDRGIPGRHRGHGVGPVGPRRCVRVRRSERAHRRRRLGVGKSRLDQRRDPDAVGPLRPGAEFRRHERRRADPGFELARSDDGHDDRGLGVSDVGDVGLEGDPAEGSRCLLPERQHERQQGGSRWDVRWELLHHRARTERAALERVDPHGRHLRRSVAAPVPERNPGGQPEPHWQPRGQ